MANKTELLARIAEIKKEMSQNGEQQSRVKQKYKGQLEALQKSKSKKDHGSFYNYLKTFTNGKIFYKTCEWYNCL